MHLSALVRFTVLLKQIAAEIINEQGLVKWVW